MWSVRRSRKLESSSTKFSRWTRSKKRSSQSWEPSKNGLTVQYFFFNPFLPQHYETVLWPGFHVCIYFCLSFCRGGETSGRNGKVQVGPCWVTRLHLQQVNKHFGLQQIKVQLSFGTWLLTLGTHPFHMLYPFNRMCTFITIEPLTASLVPTQHLIYSTKTCNIRNKRGDFSLNSMNTPAVLPFNVKQLSSFRIWNL